MQQQYHLQAFEIFAILCTYDDKVHGNVGDMLQNLAAELDAFYGGNACRDILKGKKTLGKYSSLSEEDLFVDFERLPLNYSHQDMLNEKDRLLIYLYIRMWTVENRLRDDFISIVGRFLLVDHILLKDIDCYFRNEASPDETCQNVHFHLVPSAVSGESLEGDWIKSNEPAEFRVKNNYQLEDLSFPLSVLYVERLKIFLLRGENRDSVKAKNGNAGFCSWEYAEPGDYLELEGDFALDFSDLKRIYQEICDLNKLTLRVEDVFYAHSPGKRVGRLNLQIGSGALVGVLGRDGAGKSTILDLLAGELTATSGEISVNNYPYRTDLYHLKGMIGYVPEEDMLFDELTVFDNLYYSARLFLGYLSVKEIRKKVEDLLRELELWPIADHVVGPYQEKNLQLGQRHLLNIALELIRDPQILIVDNAPSPLNLSDSSKIIEVLSSYTFKGRIVITSITQTETAVFQYFDHLLVVGEGGRPEFFSKVRDAVLIMLDKIGLQPDPEYHPGPGRILQLLGIAVNHDDQDSSGDRHSSPGPKDFSMSGPRSDQDHHEKERKILPKNILRPPTLDRQYIIFSLRNFKTKLSRKKELLVTIFSAPLLALLLAIILRDGSDDGYSFNLNRNIPVFFFLSFVLAVFLGLVLAAKEIFRERRIIQKQAYLNISKFSYINSKITYLFIIAFLQSFLFVGISHFVLQIKDMLMVHGLIFFSCQAFGLLTGLILSESHRTTESIYTRSIPIVLLFLFLFGGGLIRFNSLTNQQKYTPLLADLMVTRWAYEAMMVYQFTENEYTRYFYAYDKRVSKERHNTFQYIPLIKRQLEFCHQNRNAKQDSVHRMLASMKYQLKRFQGEYDIFPYENIDSLTPQKFSDRIAKDLSEYIEYVQLQMLASYNEAVALRKSHEQELTESMGSDYLRRSQKEHSNEAVARVVTNEGSRVILDESEVPPTLLVDQIYRDPVSRFGRTQLFFPKKNINGQLIDTLEFNVSVIWLINLLLYIFLLSDFFNIRYRK